MEKLKFVYRLEKEMPSRGEFGHLFITVQDMENTTSDRIFIKWQCNLYEHTHQGWYGFHLKWDHENYNLQHLLPKMQKANIGRGSTVEEVIDFLHAHRIEQALFVNLVTEEQRYLFDGLISVKEILNGKFIRYYNRKKFTILANQQARLIEEIQESKKMILGPQLKRAV